jgi:hypothetical protein
MVSYSPPKWPEFSFSRASSSSSNSENSLAIPSPTTLSELPSMESDGQLNEIGKSSLMISFKGITSDLVPVLITVVANVFRDKISENTDKKIKERKSYSVSKR